MSTASNPKQDRRVLRTRTLLREALLQLVIERGYDALTISDITDRADLRRATFYLHYKDKDELLLRTLDELLDGLVARLETQRSDDFLGGKSSAAVFEATFRFVAENVPLYRALLHGQGGMRIMGHIREYLSRLLVKDLQGLPPHQLQIPAAVLANYIAGAETAMIAWWLENDCPYPPEVMATMVFQLMMQGVMSAIPPV